MKRRLTLISALCLVALTLFSCMVTPNDEGGFKGNGTVYSSDTPVSLIVSGDNELNYVTDYYVDLYKRLYDSGISVKRKDDSMAISESEIAFGRTERAASVFLYDKFAAESGADYVSFGICYKDGTLAIGGVDERSMTIAMEYFYAELYSDSELKVAADYFYYVNKPYTQYMEEKFAAGRAEDLESFGHRFDEAAVVLSNGGVGALTALYELYDEDVVLWMAGLWDNTTGAFYYSNSALAYAGFAPDLESTRQALAMIKNTGFVNAYNLNGDSNEALRAALPDDIEAKIVSFVQSTQSEEDGYFYHKQWSSVTDARRGRDLDWAIEILAMLDAKPLYPTALDRLSGASATSAVARVVAAAAQGLPSHLRSEENFKAYLDSFDIVANSFSTGHTIAAQASQIKAAGLIDFVCDYMDAIQKRIYDEQIAAGETPTGLWEKTVSMNSVSGLYKIGALYNAAGRQINYVAECVDSCIKCILSYSTSDSALTDIVYVFNPWAAMNTALTSMKRDAESGTSPELEAVYAKVRAQAEELISVAAGNLSAFKREDGGFSYFREYSNPNMQGAPVSLGLAEGDYNATNVAIHSIPGMVTNCLGISAIPRYNCEHLDLLLETMESAGEITKTEIDYSLDEDFNSYGEDDAPFGYSGFDIVDDPFAETEGDKAALISSPAGANVTGSISLGFESAFTNAFFEADLMVAKGANGYTHQIYFQGNSSANKMYMITIKVSDGIVTIADSSYNGTGAINTPTGISFPVDEWHKLRWEIYTFSDEQGNRTLKTKIFLDGDFVAVSENYWGKQNGTDPVIDMTKMYCFTLKNPASDLYIDNVYADVMNDVEWSMDGYEPLIGETVEIDFDDNTRNYYSSLGYTGSTAEIVDSPDGGDGKALKYTKTDTKTSGVFDTYGFNAPGITASTFSFTADILLESVTSTQSNVYQLCFGTFGSKSVYMLTVNLGSGGFYLGDNWNTGGGKEQKFDGVYSYGEWHTLTVEITVTDDPEEFLVTILIDGDEYTSNNYYNKNKEEGAAPATSIPVVEMRALKNTKGSIYFDNIYMEFYEQ